MNSNSAGSLPGKKKLSRGWRYVLALCSVVLLGALFYGEENWRGRHAWEKYRQEVLKRGEPIDAASLVPAPVSDDENFAMTPLLAPLYDFVPGTQQWRDTNGFARAQNFPPDFNAALSEVKQSNVVRSNSWAVRPLDLAAWNAALHKSKRNAQPVVNNSNSATAAQDVLSALDQYDSVIEELRAASRRPHSRFNMRYENDNPAAVLLPHLAVLKRTTQLLQLRASAELAAGRADQAFEDLKLMFFLVDSIRNEPILISLLVRIAEFNIALQPFADGLAGRQWNEAQLTELQEKLSRFDFILDARRTLEGERVVFGLRVIDYVRNSPSKWRVLQEFSGPSDQVANEFDPIAVALVLLPTGWFDLEKVNYHRLFEESMLPMIDMQGRRINPTKAHEAETHMDVALGKKGLEAVFGHRVFTAMLLPAVTKAAQRAANAQSAADQAMLACALERYRLARENYPDTLEALVPQFVSKLPHDVITGGPLHYQRTEDGHFVLYSVGWNEKDDGGVVSLTKGGAVDSQNGDWVWR